LHPNTKEEREQGRPASKMSQQVSEPGPVCKTSIPGSNPGGASKIPQKLASFVRTWHNLALASVPEFGPLQSFTTS
jgi:hypothetical protein